MAKEFLVTESRAHYLDNIRSIIIVFVVFFHGILPYIQACPWWYVTDPPPIPYSFFFILFLEPILMPILFFISGLLAWPSFERKGAYLFMAGKVKRLIIPFLFCTFLFSPIMPFIRQSLRGANSGSQSKDFWPFWLSFLKSGSKIHSGSASLDPNIVVNQYWFLMLLFLFFSGFCLYASIRGRIYNGQSDRGANNPTSQSASLGRITIFSLVIGILYALFCFVIDGNIWVTLGSLWQVQPAKIPIYLGFFLAGLTMERRNLLPDLLEIARPALWFAATVLVTTVYFTTVLMTSGVADASLVLVIASRLLRIFLIVSVSLWLLTLFNRRFNKSKLLWLELSSNSYNIYLIHMVPLVVFQLIALSWAMPSLFKFGAVNLLALLVSYLASRFLVRRSSTATILSLVLLFILLSLIFR